MREFQTSVDIRATRSQVWAVLRDVERWAEWTSSVNAIRPQAAPLGLGVRVQVDQPRLPAGVWTVTAWEPERGFTWVQQNPGARITAGHWMEDLPEGCRVTLTVRMEGWLSGMVAWLTASLNRRYLALEAEGLKRRSEALAEDAAGTRSAAKLKE